MVRPLLVCVLLLWTAAPAEAAEFVHGDGYALQIPVGYEKVDVKGLAAAGAMGQVAALLPTKGTPGMHVFFKGDQLAPEGTIVVLRGAMASHVAGNPIDVIQKRMAALQPHDLGVSGKPSIRRRKVDGYEAIELTVQGTLEGAKDPQHLHLLVVPGGSFVMSLLMVHKPSEGLASDDWADLLATFEVAAPHDALRRVVVWGGVALAVLFVLLFLIRITRGAPGGRRVDFSRAGEALLAGPSAFENSTVGAGPGVTRAHDGLPVFHGGSTTPGRGRPAPTGSPADTFTPERRPPGHPTAATLPGLKPTKGKASR